MLAETAFSASLIDADERVELLTRAAGILDRRGTKLGGGLAQETPEGRLARAFAEDRAALEEPEVHRLDDTHVVREGVPVTSEELKRLAGYYWIALPVTLWTGSGHAFTRLEVRVTFAEGDNGGRPRVINAVPAQQLTTRFALGADLSLSVRGDLGLQVGLPDLPLDAIGVPAEVTAKAGLDGEAGAKLVLGPFKYAVRSTVVKRLGMGGHQCWWELEAASFEGDNDPGLRMIVMVPHSDRKLRVSAELLATRSVTFMGNGFVQALRVMPEKLREFFNGGTPIAATGRWDLSERL